jgi:hypothetical protein
MALFLSTSDPNFLDKRPSGPAGGIFFIRETWDGKREEKT